MEWGSRWKRRREIITWVTVGLVVLLILTAAAYILLPHLQPQSTLRLGDGIFKARIVSSPPTRDSDLRAAGGLSPEAALIVAYSRAERWPIDTSQLTVPIDIVWLNGSKEVIYIVKNTPAEAVVGQVYTPKEAAMYVIELAGGTVDKKMVVIGDQAVFNEDGIRKQDT